MPNKEPPINPRLSKSKYLSGLQCHKRLYLQIHSPELATPIDESSQALMDMGSDVGELARQRFPGGVHVEHDHLHRKEALQQTAQLLNDPNVQAIFEGAFEFENVLVRVDILERVGEDKWRLIEVKASTKVKDEHHSDVAVQTYVLKGAGIALASSWLMHLNNKYAYQGGEFDLERLFTLKDLTAETAKLQSKVPLRLAEMRAALAAALPPAIEPDHHCHEPYDCPFWDHCTKDKPARWVYHLPGSGKKKAFQDLVKRGIETIDEIPDGYKLTVLQKRMKDNAEWVNHNLGKALKTVQYPVHHLDFETFMPAIPKYLQSRPYQTIPFQWSNHVESEDGSVQHSAYLSTDQKDPREEFALSLLESVGKTGSICVYSSYEKARLKELAITFPKLKRELERVISRLWDLYRIIPNHYYHPQFNGSFSIKDVLEAVAPTLSYRDLKIKGGTEASQQYYHMVFEATDPAEKERIRLALLAYCERDTLAMVELRRVLLARAEAA